MYNYQGKEIDPIGAKASENFINDENFVKSRAFAQFLSISLSHRRKFGRNSSYRVNSVIEGNMKKIVFTKLTRSSKET